MLSTIFSCFWAIHSISITNTASNNDVTISVLRVITVENGQYGDYECKANNKLGAAEAKVNLFGKLFVHSIFKCFIFELNSLFIDFLLFYFFPQKRIDRCRLSMAGIRPKLELILFSSFSINWQGILFLYDLWFSICFWLGACQFYFI